MMFPFHFLRATMAFLDSFREWYGNLIESLAEKGIPVPHILVPAALALVIIIFGYFIFQALFPSSYSQISFAVNDDSGNPVPEAKVKLLDSSGNVISSKQSDAKGKVSFVNVPTSASVEVHRPGYKDALTVASQLKETGAISLALLAPIAAEQETISIQVLGDGSNPVANALVALQFDNGNFLQTQADSFGIAEFNVSEIPMHVVALVQASGFENSQTSLSNTQLRSQVRIDIRSIAAVEAERKKAEEDALKNSARTKGTLTAIVSDENGNAIVAAVELMDANGRTFDAAKTNDLGEAQFSIPLQKPFSIRAKDTGGKFLLGIVDEFYLDQINYDQRRVMVLEKKLPENVLQISIQSNEGVSIPDARVQIFDRSFRLLEEKFSDANGEVEFTVNAKAGLKVGVYAQGFLPLVSSPLKILLLEPQTFENSVEVIARVVDELGEVVSDAQVLVKRKDGAVILASVPVAADGVAVLQLPLQFDKKSYSFQIQALRGSVVSKSDEVSSSSIQSQQEFQIVLPRPIVPVVVRPVDAISGKTIPGASASVPASGQKCISSSDGCVLNLTSDVNHDVRIIASAYLPAAASIYVSESEKREEKIQMLQTSAARGISAKFIGFFDLNGNKMLEFENSQKYVAKFLISSQTSVDRAFFHLELDGHELKDAKLSESGQDNFFTSDSSCFSPNSGSGVRAFDVEFKNFAGSRELKVELSTPGEIAVASELKVKYNFVASIAGKAVAFPFEQSQQPSLSPQSLCNLKLVEEKIPPSKEPLSCDESICHRITLEGGKGSLGSKSISVEKGKQFKIKLRAFASNDSIDSITLSNTNLEFESLGGKSTGEITLQEDQKAVNREVLATAIRATSSTSQVNVAISTKGHTKQASFKLAITGTNPLAVNVQPKSLAFNKQEAQLRVNVKDERGNPVSDATVSFADCEGTPLQFQEFSIQGDNSRNKGQNGDYISTISTNGVGKISVIVSHEDFQKFEQCALDVKADDSIIQLQPQQMIFRGNASNQQPQQVVVSSSSQLSMELSLAVSCKMAGLLQVTPDVYQLVAPGQASFDVSVAKKITSKNEQCILKVNGKINPANAIGKSLPIRVDIESDAVLQAALVEPLPQVIFLKLDSQNTAKQCFSTKAIGRLSNLAIRSDNTDFNKFVKLPDYSPASEVICFTADYSQALLPSANMLNQQGTFYADLPSFERMSRNIIVEFLKPPEPTAVTVLPQCQLDAQINSSCIQSGGSVSSIFGTTAASCPSITCNCPTAFPFNQNTLACEQVKPQETYPSLPSRILIKIAGPLKFESIIFNASLPNDAMTSCSIRGLPAEYERFVEVDFCSQTDSRVKILADFSPLSPLPKKQVEGFLLISLRSGADKIIPLTIDLQGSQATLQEINASCSPQTGGQCVAGYCLNKCIDASNCAAGIPCNNGRCELSCNPQAPQCPVGFACPNGFCIRNEEVQKSVCQNQQLNCPPGSTCFQNSICMPQAPQNSQCPFGTINTQGACVTPCQTPFQCPNGLSCIKGVCAFPQSQQCGAIQQDLVLIGQQLQPIQVVIDPETGKGYVYHEFQVPQTFQQLLCKYVFGANPLSLQLIEKTTCTIVQNPILSPQSQQYSPSFGSQYSNYYSTPYNNQFYEFPSPQLNPYLSQYQAQLPQQYNQLQPFANPYYPIYSTMQSMITQKIEFGIDASKQKAQLKSGTLPQLQAALSFLTPSRLFDQNFILMRFELGNADELPFSLPELPKQTAKIIVSSDPQEKGFKYFDGYLIENSCKPNAKEFEDIVKLSNTNNMIQFSIDASNNELLKKYSTKDGFWHLNGKLSCDQTSGKMQRDFEIVILPKEWQITLEKELTKTITIPYGDPSLKCGLTKQDDKARANSCKVSTTTITLALDYTKAESFEDAVTLALYKESKEKGREDVLEIALLVNATAAAKTSRESALTIAQKLSNASKDNNLLIRIYDKNNNEILPGSKVIPTYGTFQYGFPIGDESNSREVLIVKGSGDVKELVKDNNNVIYNYRTVTNRTPGQSGQPGFNAPSEGTYHMVIITKGGSGEAQLPAPLTSKPDAQQTSMQTTTQTTATWAQGECKKVCGAAFDKTVLDYSQKYNLDPATVCGIIMQESSLVPTKVNPNSGAQGLMQILPAQAGADCKNNGIVQKTASFLDVETNIACGTWYFSQRMKVWKGNESDAIQAYHDGDGGWRAIKSGTSQTAESKAYTPSVLANKNKFVQSMDSACRSTFAKQTTSSTSKTRSKASLAEIISKPSPNKGSRGGSSVQYVVIHDTETSGFPNNLVTPETGGPYFCDKPDPANNGVSAHYVVGRKGEIWHLVPETESAFHAGCASFLNQKNSKGQPCLPNANVKEYCPIVENPNPVSIGIEIIGFESQKYPLVQMKSVAALVKDIAEFYGIPKSRVVSHQQIAPKWRTDPGPNFDWNYLNAYVFDKNANAVCSKCSA